MTKGRFYGVGVGAGEGELLTLKAVRILEQCPVWVTPQTHSGQMLALEIAESVLDSRTRTIAPLVFSMQKDKTILAEEHKTAVGIIRDYLDKGQDVAMLVLGDASIFASVQYLLPSLQEEGYATEIIPGVPSFCAIAARLQVSLTEANLPLHILPATDHLAEGLALSGTKVLMKSGKHLGETVSYLQEIGWAERCGMVQACGLPNERVYPSLAGVKLDNLNYFSTILVPAEDKTP